MNENLHASGDVAGVGSVFTTHQFGNRLGSTRGCTLSHASTALASQSLASASASAIHKAIVHIRDTCDPRVTLDYLNGLIAYCESQVVTVKDLIESRRD